MTHLTGASPVLWLFLVRKVLVAELAQRQEMRRHKSFGLCSPYTRSFPVSVTQCTRRTWPSLTDLFEG